MTKSLIVAISGLLLAEAASGQPCPGDFNQDGQVTVDEILIVVNASLIGCNPPATPTVPAAATVTATPSRTPTRTRTATATPRFRDNGDGTITDTSTDLMWEKKGDGGGAHDKDLLFSWSVSGSTQPNGTAFSSFLAALNSQRLGGHRDWRLPTRNELESLVAAGGGGPQDPRVPPAFDDDCRPGCDAIECSCTVALNYWTATSNAANAQQAWYVLFNNGQSGVGFKTLQFHVRAVRDDD
ncbi:MAG TPA: DUF1566 domain-containing protein [Terriglobales bacterium]|nr:DUF1566 domain-containing protein [Terriglobales bacterium]